MQITVFNSPTGVSPARPKASTLAPSSSQTQLAPEPGETLQLSSAFSARRDLTYAVGASLSQLPNVITGIAGRSYGVPHAVGAAVGGLMAAAGARELMTENSLHGRINGGIHLAVGAMTAVAPWSGPLSAPLYVASMATLAAKAFADRPGTVLGIAGGETVAMSREVFGGLVGSRESEAAGA